MPVFYLLPTDVPVAEAQRVLAFLNAASSAQEIAAAVEFPDERDVGVRVAQRILNRRAELGGFTSMAQVNDVPYVGPERFTEIVMALTGLRVFAPTPEAGGGEVAALRRELQALRTTVAHLERVVGPRPRLTMRSLLPRPFLGQPVTLEAALAAGGGGRAGRLVTFVTTWGRLHAPDGVARRQGASVTVPLGPNGRAQVTLLPGTSEDVTGAQQSALEAHLRLLDPDAATPLQQSQGNGENGLLALAEAYRREVNTAFRDGLDVYFHDYGPSFLERVNHFDLLAAWTYVDAAVLAFLHVADEGDAASAVEQTAALSLRFKNWLGPWLATYLNQAGEAASLEAMLAEATALGPDAAGIVDSVFQRVQDFVSAQRGVVGGALGRHVAQTSLHRFFETGTQALPLEIQAALLPTLHEASQTVRALDVGTFTVLRKTRTDVQRVKRELDLSTAALPDLIDALLPGRLDAELDARLPARIETELAAFQDSVNASLATKLDAETFDSFSSSINSNISSIDNRVITIRGDVDRIERR